MLTTTPTITWSTKYVTVKTARIQPTSRPATTAAMSPASRLSVSEPTTADRKAPASNWPSIAMLTTPARSHRTPDRAPKISGTLSSSEPWSRPVSGMDLPETAQVRNDIMKAIPKAAIAHAGVGLRLRAHIRDSPAMARQTSPIRRAKTFDGTIRSGSEIVSPGIARTNVVVSPEVPITPKTTSREEARGRP